MSAGVLNPHPTTLYTIQGVHERVRLGEGGMSPLAKFRIQTLLKLDLLDAAK